MVNFTEDKHLEAIAEKVKTLVTRLKQTGGESLDDHILLLKYWWSKHYNRPMKDPLLEEYDLYDLYLEFYFHTLDKESVTKDAFETNKEELSNLFNDLEEDDKKFVAAQFPEATKKAEAPPPPKEENWSMSEADF